MLVLLSTPMGLLLAAEDRGPAPFAVGVMRRDGILIPFAAFDGKHWSRNWPPPTASNLEVPINVASVPQRWWGPTAALSEWQVWTAAGPQIVHVQQPDWVDVHCFRQVVLRTDYRSLELAPPATDQVYPKDGLAVSPPRQVAPIEILSPDSDEVAGLTDVLHRAFNRAERETANQFGDPVKESVREKYDPEVEAAYAFGRAPRAYYVEARRVYRDPNGLERGCRMAFGTSWLVRDGTQPAHPADTAVDLLSCSEYGASYMLPLGVVTVADRTFWVVQYSGWLSERFVVVEIKKDKVEAVSGAFGGAC